GTRSCLVASSTVDRNARWHPNSLFGFQEIEIVLRNLQAMRIVGRDELPIFPWLRLWLFFPKRDCIIRIGGRLCTKRSDWQPASRFVGQVDCQTSISCSRSF